MKYSGRMVLALALPLLSLVPGCANTYERNHTAAAGTASCGRMVIAVMPFQGVSESPGSGLIVADVMANELYALGGQILVTPEVMAARAAPREGEVLTPEEAGRMVGARFIVTGRVTEYTYKSGVGEQPAVGVTARLIECATGRVLWSATRARTGSAAWFQEDSLGLLTSRICRDLALSLKGTADTYGYGAEEDDFYAAANPVVKDAPKEEKKDAAANAPAETGASAPAVSPAEPAAGATPVPEPPQGTGTDDTEPVALYDDEIVPYLRPGLPGAGNGESAILY